MEMFFAASDVLLPDAAAAAGIGLSITFGVLLLLIGLLYAFRAIFSLFGDKKAKNAPAPAPVHAGNDDKAVVAAIVGAIAAYRDDPDTAVKVTKIEKKD